MAATAVTVGEWRKRLALLSNVWAGLTQGAGFVVRESGAHLSSSFKVSALARVAVRCPGEFSGL